MKIKYLKKMETKTKSKKADKKWIIIVSTSALLISALLSLLSELILPNTFIVINIVLVILFIALGIVFDIIGVAITTAEEKMFHAMATKKIKGAKRAIKLIKNKEKASSFCNDVIGDICGVVSGSCGITIAVKMASLLEINVLIPTIIVTSLISALTIGGKAIGKAFAVNNSNEIVFTITKI